MSADTKETLTITTETIDVASLREGDLLHYAFPAPHYRVVANERRGHVLAPNRRSAVILVDSEGVAKRFRLSPRREVERVTNPAVPVGPWFFDMTATDISLSLRSWQREDALWHKTLWPLAKPFVRLWREFLDLQCRAYTLRLQRGFLSVLAIIVVVVFGILTGTPDEFSVPIGIVGAFCLERYWEHWHARARRKLATGTSMRVRYKPYGPEELRYGTLALQKKGGFILGGTPGQVWFTTEMGLRQGKRVLATCVFANDLKGDLRYTTSEVANAIRHRLDNGSRRVIYAPSSTHDPTREALLDITIGPSDRGFSLDFPDSETGRRFSIKLKLYQVRILADVLEIMDEGRRL